MYRKIARIYYFKMVKSHFNRSNYPDELNFYRDVTFLKSLIIIHPFTIIPLVLCLNYGLTIGSFAVVFWSIITYLTLWVITFPSSLSILNRKKIMTIGVYNLGLQLLINSGMDHSGILYWTIGNIMVSLFFQRINYVTIISINVLMAIIIGCIIYFNYQSTQFSVSLSLFDWILIAINNLFLSAIISILFTELISRIHRESVKKKQIKLNLIKSKANIENTNKLLQQKNNELEEIAHVTSHNLQEPLRLVTCFLNLLDAKYKDQLDQRGKQYIHFALNGANEMRKVMLEILSFSKINVDESQLEEINLDLLIDEVVWMNRRLIQENNSQLIIDQLPTIVGNKTLLRTLFSNLLTNAIKYKSNARISIIKITCNFEGAFLIFTFHDNGIGISEDKIDQIFQLFNKGGIHNYPVSGSGIGLAICKKIMNLLNGEIEVSSVLNEGTTFRVKLPLMIVKTN